MVDKWCIVVKWKDDDNSVNPASNSRTGFEKHKLLVNDNIP